MLQVECGLRTDLVRMSEDDPLVLCLVLVLQIRLSGPLFSFKEGQVPGSLRTRTKSKKVNPLLLHYTRQFQWRYVQKKELAQENRANNVCQDVVWRAKKNA